MAHAPGHCLACLGKRLGTREKAVGKERLVVNGRDLQRYGKACASPNTGPAQCHCPLTVLALSYAVSPPRMPFLFL